MTTALVGYGLFILVGALGDIRVAAPDVLLVTALTLAARGRVAGGAAAVVALAYVADVYAGAPLGLNLLAKGVVYVAACRAGAHVAWENRLAQGVVGGMAGLADGHIAYAALAMVPVPHAAYVTVAVPLVTRAALTGVAAMILMGPLLRVAARVDRALPVRGRHMDILFGPP